MRVATLDLTPELFVEFCKASKGSDRTRKFVVRENPLPNDAEIVRVGIRETGTMQGCVLRLFVQSQAFEDVLEGSVPPELPLVVFEAIYDGAANDKCPSCGIDFTEFPDVRHLEDECGGPECTCYEVIGGHQMGCYFYGRTS